MIQAREYDYKYYFEGTGKLEHIKLKVKKIRTCQGLNTGGTLKTVQVSPNL